MTQQLQGVRRKQDRGPTTEVEGHSFREGSCGPPPGQAAESPSQPP